MPINLINQAKNTPGVNYCRWQQKNQPISLQVCLIEPISIQHPYIHLNEYPLDEAQPDEDEQVLDKMDADADDTLRVETDQHHPLPSELVGESAEYDPAHHDPAKVGSSDEGGEEASVADQLPLGCDGPFVLLSEMEGVSILRGGEIHKISNKYRKVRKYHRKQLGSFTSIW
jgi:hypothetical protein